MLTATEALRLAVEHHKAGRLDEARAVYEAMVAQAPRNPEILRVFAVLADHSGQPETALRYIEGALVLKPRDPVLLTLQGGLLTTLRRYPEAVQVLTQVRDAAPQDAASHFALGQAQMGVGQVDEARVSVEQALFLDPEHAGAHNLQGVVYRALRSPAAAHAAFERAVNRRPSWAAAHCNLGSTAQLLGRPEEALEHFGRALELAPDLVDACVGMASAHLDVGGAAEALEPIQHAAALAPDAPQVHNTRGRVLQALGRLDDAVQAFRRTIALRGDWAVPHSNLGQLQRQLGQLEAAQGSCTHAIRLDRSSPDAWNNLGVVRADLGDMSGAIEAFEYATTLSPRHTNAQLSLAQCRLTLGQLDRAVEVYRAALRAGADPARVRSRLVMALQYSPHIRASRLGAEVAKWAATQPALAARPPQRALAADAVLRVGFVSSDIRDHPVGQCIEAMVSASQGVTLSYHFYVSQLTHDARTARIRQHAHSWTDVHGMADQSVADRIRKDAIDILVDLSGHTARHRLGVFARRPAPVQVSWLGYFASTGLPAMDFILADEVVCPTGAADGYTESVIRLGRPYGCFFPPEFPLAVTPPPSLMQGHLTLGCFNNLLKLNVATASMWAEILAALPQAHLLLKTPALSVAEVRRRVMDMLVDVGVPQERIRLEGKTPRMQHIAAYGEVDIALDTWPCSGGITSAEAVWMGVPVMTLPSDRFAGRITTDLLKALGLSECVASDRDDYVARVVALANDQARLIAYRRDLRRAFLASSLCDGADLARAFEAGLREAWARVAS